MWSGEGWRDFEAKLLTQRGSSKDAGRSCGPSPPAPSPTRSTGRAGCRCRSTCTTGRVIDKDVVVVGALDHAELWSPDRLEVGRAEMDELNDLVEGMSF